MNMITDTFFNATCYYLKLLLLWKFLKLYLLIFVLKLFPFVVNILSFVNCITVQFASSICVFIAFDSFEI